MNSSASNLIKMACEGYLRGEIFHMLRNDDPEFRQFGEIYFSTINVGATKAWHLHKEMTLNYLLVVGSVRFVVMDDREQSSSFGRFQEIFLDPKESKLVSIPPWVWNGFTCLGQNPSIIANCATVPHRPDEIIRRSSQDPYFEYSWSSSTIL
jgi:dTDP-4-dehydrorhamnose 3,5-epimerase